MLLKIHPENPEGRKIKTAVDSLQQGGVIIYPTDTVYGMGCDLNQAKAFEKICRIKGINPEKATFSFVFTDISQIAEYTKTLDTPVFKVLKKALPGPFTFILECNNNIPKHFRNKKKTIGIRIPDNNIAKEIIGQLGNPILSTSIHDEDEVLDYTTDPELIHEKYEKQVDLVIDGGYGNNVPSTVVDCTNGDFQIIRQGLGKLEDFI